MLRPHNTSVKLQSRVTSSGGDRWLLAEGKHLFFHLFVSCVLFIFLCVLVIKSLLVCYCICSLLLNTFAFEEIIYKNLKSKTSLNNTNMTNPEKGRK